MPYQPREGFHISHNNAEVLGRHFEKLRDEGQKVEKYGVLDSARPADSPIHDFFEWDDHKAAEEHRLAQASYYIRGIEFVSAEHPEPIRAYHYVKMEQDEEPSYQHIEVIRQNPILISQIRENARQKLISWQLEFRQYDALAKEILMVGEVVKQLSFSQEGVANEQ